MIAAPAAVRSSPPTPEECEHPAPVRGIMAHEFAPYRMAMGPEGRRRTTMHYGPIVGGLPIAAWHCGVCGLLRLDYPDGRKDERRLFPGAQPGLLAEAVAEAVAPEAGLGMQARVSGLTVPARVYRQLVPEQPRRTVALPAIPIPGLAEAVNWVVVAAIAATLAGLVGIAIGAVYSYRTASWVGPLSVITAATFGGALLLKLADVAFRHFVPWPQLAPTSGEALDGRPRLDGASRVVVAILVTLMVGLTIAAFLAVYDWKTPDIERPLVDTLIALFVLGTLVAIAGGVGRALAAGRPPPDPDL